MNLKISVAVTVNDRPEYLAEVLESWHEVRGINEVPVIFQVEPSSPSLQLCLKAAFPKQTVVVNSHQKGALGNPKAAMETAFELGADFAIVGEDDSTVTADILEYFAFAADRFVRDERAIAICSFQYRPAAESFYVIRRRYFASVIWGTWLPKWEYDISPYWRHDYNPAWDRMLLDKAVGENYCIFPAVSRSQHIGKYRGTHMQEADFEILQARVVHDGSKQRYRILEGIL